MCTLCSDEYENSVANYEREGCICKAGYEGTIGSCTVCPGTDISFAGGQCGICTDTNEHSRINDDGDGCICLAGYEEIDGECMECETGKYSENDGGECILCSLVYENSVSNSERDRVYMWSRV